MKITLHKKIKKKLALALMVSALFLPLVTTSANAAKNDIGEDWSVYQGPNGKWGYGNEKFVLCQIGGTTTGWNTYGQWTYDSQVKTAIAQGKRAHTYVWFQNVTSTQQADYQMDYWLPKVQTPKGSIVALDIESGAQNTAAVDEACKKIASYGFTPMIYGYKGYLLSHVDLKYLAGKYQLYLAEYPNYSVRRYPNYNFFPSFENIGIFQFTSTYIAGGLDGDVDLTGITDNGYKGGNAQKPKSNTPTIEAGKQIHRDTHNYTVKSGDSWWKIANDHHMNMYALAQLNGATIQTVIHPGQVLRVADSGQGSKVSNKVQQPIAQPKQSSWRDSLGDTWHAEKGTFVADTWLHLRWGAKPSSSSIALIGPGSVIKYDAYSRHNGYVWIRQPRGNGQYGYVVVRNAYTSHPYGTFK